MQKLFLLIKVKSKRFRNNVMFFGNDFELNFFYGMVLFELNNK